MKILEIKTLVFPEIKVIKFARFLDNRGYFTELYKQSDFQKIDFLNGAVFKQNNGSYSKKGVIRGLHLQWDPYMNKLVRTITGHMVDLFLDVRVGSPTFGKIGVYNMKIALDNDFVEWIWVPVGFAHGSLFLEESVIEYYCTSEYSPQTEASISPFAPDIDWSFIDPSLKNTIEQAISKSNISEKDKKGYTMAQWLKDEKSKNFIYDVENRV